MLCSTLGILHVEWSPGNLAFYESFPQGRAFCFFNFGSLWTAVAQSSEVEADGQILFCRGVASPKCKNWGPTEREADGRKEWRVYMAMTTVLPFGTTALPVP